MLQSSSSPQLTRWLRTSWRRIWTTFLERQRRWWMPWILCNRSIPLLVVSIQLVDITISAKMTSSGYNRFQGCREFWNKAKRERSYSLFDACKGIWYDEYASSVRWLMLTQHKFRWFDPLIDLRTLETRTLWDLAALFGADWMVSWIKWSAMSRIAEMPSTNTTSRNSSVSWSRILKFLAGLIIASWNSSDHPIGRISSSWLAGTFPSVYRNFGMPWPLGRRWESTLRSKSWRILPRC